MGEQGGCLVGTGQEETGLRKAGTGREKEKGWAPQGKAGQGRAGQGGEQAGARIVRDSVSHATTAQGRAGHSKDNARCCCCFPLRPSPCGWCYFPHPPLGGAVSPLLPLGRCCFPPFLFWLALLLPFLLGGCISLSPSPWGWCCPGVSALDSSYRFVSFPFFFMFVVFFRVTFLLVFFCSVFSFHFSAFSLLFFQYSFCFHFSFHFLFIFSLLSIFLCFFSFFFSFSFFWKRRREVETRATHLPEKPRSHAIPRFAPVAPVSRLHSLVLAVDHATCLQCSQFSDRVTHLPVGSVKLWRNGSCLTFHALCQGLVLVLPDTMIGILKNGGPPLLSYLGK